MSNTIYENFILESKLTDLLNTKLAARSLMTLDTSLVGQAGEKKTINVYTYTGAVETMATVGATNSTRGAISFVPVSYDLLLSQQVFDYYDEEISVDPKILDMGMEGSASLMVNDINTKYFAELAKGTVGSTWVNGGAISYDTVVDAISLMTLEDETGLFLIISTDLKADLRKDPDFMAARQGEMLFNGQIGSISGVPVVVSKLTPASTAYLATKDAVTLFTKKDSEVEQARDAESRMNTVILRKVELVALTNDTKVVVLTEAAV